MSNEIDTKQLTKDTMPLVKDTKQLTKEHFDEHAKTYDRELGTFAASLYRPLLSQARRERPNRVLDLGCGTGNILKLMHEENPDAYYCGVDISPNMVKQAKEKLSADIKILECDVEMLPFDEDSFDVVICNASFHHYTNPLRVIDEIKRVLKSGGCLVLGDPCPPTGLGGYYNRHKKHESEHRLYTAIEFKKLFTYTGFDIEYMGRPAKDRILLKARLNK